MSVLDSVRLNGAKKSHTSLVTHERPWKYYFSSEKMEPELPPFHVIST